MKPNRDDERKQVGKKKMVQDEDSEHYRQKEMLREKLKNQSILREVLKKQVKEM